MTEQDRTSQPIQMSDVVFSLTQTAQDQRLLPTITGATLEVSTQAFRDVLGMVLKDEIETPVATLRFESCEWIDGGASVTLRLMAGRIIPVRVTIDAALQATPEGRLRIRLSGVRAGPAPVTAVLGPLLDKLAEHPGLHRADDLAVDADIGELLRARDVPVIWDAPVRQVDAHPGIARLIVGR